MTARKGRASKGERDLFLTRTTVPVGQSVRASAEREGYLSLSDYVAAVLAEHEGMPDQAPQPRPRSAQEALDISA